MKRTLLLASLTVLLIGCQLPPERLPRALPDDSAPLPYAEMLTRARAQARVAYEALFVDNWPDVEDAARGLEQTAKFLLKADDVPPNHRAMLPRVCANLASDGAKLREAALAKNAKESTAILQRINLTVREMRLDPGK
jgi:hypothetical protein